MATRKQRIQATSSRDPHEMIMRGASSSHDYRGSGYTTSPWMDDRLGVVRALPLSLLDDDADADVCIVGAGIAGLTTAYLLAREGRRVIVLEARGVGGGESLRSTGHLVTVLDQSYGELTNLHGAAATRLIARSHGEAINRIELICRLEGIDCDLERLDGYLCPPRTRLGAVHSWKGS